MSSRRRRWFGSLGLVVCVVAAGLLSAQPDSSPAPSSLLPEQAVIYVGIDGGREHLEAWKQTAAYQSLYESGLVDVATKFFAAVQEQSGGPEGVPGQLAGALTHVVDRGLSLAVTLGQPDGPPAPWAILVLHDAAEFEPRLGELIAEIARGEIEFETKTVNGRSVKQGMVPRTPGVEIGWWKEEGHLVVAAGINAVQSAITVAEGETNITANPLWKKYATADAGFEVASVGWLDFAAFRSKFGGIPLPPVEGKKRATVNDIVTLLGLDGLNSIVGRSGYKGPAIWQEMKIDSVGPRKGLLAMSDQESFTLADLPALPANSSGFVASSFDWSKAYDEFVKIAHGLEEILPTLKKGDVDNALAKVQEHLGFDLKTELLDAIGNIHCLYADSAQMPFGLGFGVAVEVDDPQSLRTSVDKLLSLLQKEAGNDVAIRRAEKDSQQVVVIEAAQGAFTPALCIGDKWLSLGIVPQSVSAFLLRQTGKLPRWEPSAEVTQALSEVPKEFTAISVSDPRPTYRLALGFAPFVMGGIQAALRESRVLPPDFQMPVSTADIPPAELVAGPLFPNVSASHVDENGVTITTRSSLPAAPFTGAVDGGTAVATSGVLVALLLPAVQQAREAARRTQSMNNLKMMMLALHNYHDVNGMFPEGTQPNEKLKPDERLSWQAKILPYLEQAALYQQIDFEEGWEEADNAQALKSRIPTYLNPSEPAEDSEYGLTHYVGTAGLGKDGPDLPAKHPRAGVFAYNRGTKIQEITDGTSNTLAITNGKHHGPWGAGGPATIRSLTQKPYINGPDGISGPHRGIVQAALCDGSVRSISENIDPKVFEALATIAGGEVVNDF